MINSVFCIGSIVNIKNIVFSDYDSKNNVKSHKVDHAMFEGRPCVYVGELNDKMYFVPLTSNIKEYLNQVVIKPNNINKLKKACNVNIKTIIDKPISYFPSTGEISEEEVINVYKKIINYYKIIKSDNIRALVTIANNYFESKNNKPKYVDNGIQKVKQKID